MKILKNAKVYTLNPDQPMADCLVVGDASLSAGRILAVGEWEKLIEEFGTRAKVEDLEGRIVMPGLTDAHLHLRQYALTLKRVDCGTAGREVCLDRVGERARSTPKGDWILGHGWNQNIWDGGFGTAQELDAAAPENPVYLTAASLHAGWANSLALKTAGIDGNTPDPHNGKIGKSQDGEPDGILFEDAMKLVSQVIPKPTSEENTAVIATAQEKLWRMGLTGGHDFDRRESFAALQILNQRGELKFRVVKSIPLEQLEQAIALGLRSGFGDNMLRIGSIKMFADGALGPHTAAMLEAYDDEPDNLGMLFADREEIFEIGRKAARGGFSMAIHSIGDRANHEVLAAYGQLRRAEKEEGVTHFRHRIEHAQIVHPEDFSAFFTEDIIASVQPIHATSDMEMADRYWGARAKNSYAWKKLLDAGARMCFGSDAPVDSPNPFWGIYAAVTRRRLDGSPGEDGWYPEQRLDVHEVIEGYTTGAAYAGGMEKVLGKLAKGYLADLIVLERDPFEIQTDEIGDLKPIATMVGGEWVWRE
ncbi:MAG: amidohydrolase [Anaerolineae bacterium]|nr:amidohydrolase [Anaerolineae bacterium]